MECEKENQQRVMGRRYEMSPEAAERARATKLAELEDQVATLETEQIRAEQDKVRAQKNKLMATHKIRDTFSDDYAVMDCADYHFYYGYEYYHCPIHGNDKCCEDGDDCEECKSEWCFVAWRLADDVEIFRIGWRELVYEEANVVNALVRGIGIFINSRLKERP